MIHFTDMTGLASSAITMAATLFMLPGIARLQRRYLILLVCAIAGVALIPFGDLPPAAYVRSVIGDLSVTSLVLLMLSILKPLFGWHQTDTQSRFALQTLIVLAAVGLYPMALGIGLFDPYRLGYGNLWLMVLLLAVALIACFRQVVLVALCIALAMFAWGAGWYESNNLWDYLLDPLLAIYAISALIKYGVQKLLKLRNND